MISIVSNNMIRFNIKSIANYLLFPKNEVHYIGGAEILPAPLSSEEENLLLTHLDDDVLEARQTLIEHNLAYYPFLNSVIGMVYDFLPFMLLPIYNSLTRIRKDWIEAARDLGANNVTIFFKIILPLSVSGIISGIVMVFVPSLTSFAISQVLGGGHVLLIGNVIEQDFMQGMQWNAGSGLSFVLMIFVIVSMALVNQFDKEGEGTAIW